MLRDAPDETAVFAAIVRTTGSRPQLLLDALQSLALQQSQCVPVLVVHGDDTRYSLVKRICDESSVASSAIVLRASDTTRRRGYPINVGLDYCLAHLSNASYIFFLDDDDIVYPFFTGTMAAAFLTSEADVVYAASNRREPWQPAEPAYSPKPVYHLFCENFIPINSYAIRLQSLRESGVRMSEDMEYTEDWHFLLRLLEAGLRFHPIATTLSEFRIVSDGNLAQKRDPGAWKAISLRIRRYINTSTFRVPGPDLVRTAESLTPSSAPPPAAPPPSPAPPAVIAPATRGADEALITSLRGRIWAMEHSLSWKCTAPARYVLGVFLGTRGRGRLAQ